MEGRYQCAVLAPYKLDHLDCRMICVLRHRGLSPVVVKCHPVMWRALFTGPLVTDAKLPLWWDNECDFALLYGVHTHGKAVQVDPIKPMLKPPRTKRVKLKYGKLLPKFAFNF